MSLTLPQRNWYNDTIIAFSTCCFFSKLFGDKNISFSMEGLYGETDGVVIFFAF